jgi:hypothetical protein
MNKVQQIISSANEEAVPFWSGFLIITTDESYESKLAKTGFRFFAFNSTDFKSWDDDEMPMPENYFILPRDSIPSWLDLRGIIIQNKIFHYGLAKKIQKILKIPIICIERSEPTQVSTLEQQVDSMKSMVGDVNIFSSSSCEKLWEIDHNNFVIEEDDEDMFVSHWSALLENFLER